MKANRILFFFGLMFRWFLRLILMQLPAIGLVGQVTDLELSGRFHPASIYLAPTDSADRRGKTSHTELNFAAMINLHTKKDSASGNIRSFGSNVQARYAAFNRDGYNKKILPSELYSLNMGLFYYSTISKKWGYNIFINASLNSDLQIVDKNDFFLTGGVIFIRHFSPNLSVGFGAIVHNNLGGFMPWPALTADWKMGGKFKLEIRTPDKGPGVAHKIAVGYRAGKSTELSFAFQPEVLSYDITTGRDINNRLMSFWQLPFIFSSTFHKGKFDIIPRIGFTPLRKYAYGEKNIREIFTEYPYHGLGTNLNFGLGLKYKPF